MGKINVAIDGYAGCGKSSTAKEVAKRIGYTYVDTGLMYRAIAYYLSQCVQEEMPLASSLARLNLEMLPVDGGIQLKLNGKWIDETLLRSEEIGKKASHYSQYPEVRAKLVSLQRAIASKKGVIMEGRDIGTVVLPDAELKIFMTADLSVRVERRYRQLVEGGRPTSREQVVRELMERDQADTQRKIAPLQPAPDAILLDTSHLTFEEQVQKIIQLIRDREQEHGRKSDCH